jgi:hypothetical protein
MTPLYAILELANEVLMENPPEDTRIARLARYVSDHLGPLLECGYESPVVNYNYTPAGIDIPEYIGVPTSDARTIASSILRACDEADEA